MNPAMSRKRELLYSGISLSAWAPESHLLALAEKNSTVLHILRKNGEKVIEYDICNEIDTFDIKDSIYISSICWHPHNPIISIGLSNGLLFLYSCECFKIIYRKILPDINDIKNLIWISYMNDISFTLTNIPILEDFLHQKAPDISNIILKNVNTTTNKMNDIRLQRNFPESPLFQDLKLHTIIETPYMRNSETPFTILVVISEIYLYILGDGYFLLYPPYKQDKGINIIKIEDTYIMRDSASTTTVNDSNNNSNIYEIDTDLNDHSSILQSISIHRNACNTLINKIFICFKKIALLGYSIFMAIQNKIGIDINNKPKDTYINKEEEAYDIFGLDVKEDIIEEKIDNNIQCNTISSTNNTISNTNNTHNILSNDINDTTTPLVLQKIKDLTQRCGQNTLVSNETENFINNLLLSNNEENKEIDTIYNPLIHALWTNTIDDTIKELIQILEPSQQQKLSESSNELFLQIETSIREEIQPYQQICIQHISFQVEDIAALNKCSLHDGKILYDNTTISSTFNNLLQFSNTILYTIQECDKLLQSLRSCHLSQQWFLRWIYMLQRWIQNCDIGQKDDIERILEQGIVQTSEQSCMIQSFLQYDTNLLTHRLQRYFLSDNYDILFGKLIKIWYIYCSQPLLNYNKLLPLKKIFNIYNQITIDKNYIITRYCDSSYNLYKFINNELTYICNIPLQRDILRIYFLCNHYLLQITRYDDAIEIYWWDLNKYQFTKEFLHISYDDQKDIDILCERSIGIKDHIYDLQIVLITSNAVSLIEYSCVDPGVV